MKKLTSLFAFIFLLSISSSFAQSPDPIEGMNRLLSKNLKYPAELRQSNTQGMVVVSIQVDQKGYMTDFEFLSGNPDFEVEIERTLSILKEDWNPSFLGDKSYNQEYLIGFDFKLSKGGEFPPNPFTSSAVNSKPITPLETVNQALERNPFSPKLYTYRAEILEANGKQLLAEMDVNKAEFLEKKMLTEVVIVGYAAQGPKSL